MTNDQAKASPIPAPTGPIPELSFAQFKALANSMPKLAGMADADGWINWCNDRGYEHTGIA